MTRPHRPRPWLVLGAALLSAFACSDFEREYPLEPSAALWSMPVAGEEHLFFVTTDERRRVHFRDLPGRRHHFVYTLHAHDTRSGRSLATALLRERAEDTREFVGIVGVADGLLWLWNEGIEARDPATLEVVLDTQAIRAANPELAALLPDESQRAGVSEVLASAVFQTLDARYFVLGRDGAAHPMTGEERVRFQEEVTRYVGRKARLVLGNPDEGVYGSVNDMRTTRQRVGGRELAFMSDARADKQRRRDPSFGGGEGDVPERIWFSDVDAGGYPDASTLRALGSSTFLLPGFVRDTRLREDHVNDAVGALVLDDSLLVLHKATLAKESAWHVSRVGLDGGVQWEADTGIADPTRLLATDRVLVVGGYGNFREPTRLRAYHLSFIDLEGGEVHAIRVSDL